jgi:hypothetical protein
LISLLAVTLLLKRVDMTDSGKVLLKDAEAAEMEAEIRRERVRS